MADKPEKPPILGEWERAQEGWDAAKRAAGATPPLPPKNSNADPPGADGLARQLGAVQPSSGEEAIREVRAHLQSLQDSGTLDRMRGVFSPSYWVNRMDREDRRRDIGAAIEQSERSSETATVAETPPSSGQSPSVLEHLHLPKTPAEGVAALAWTVLVLAFGFLFIESLGELLPSPAWRAAFGFVGMVGVTVMLIYRAWLIERFRALSGWALLIAIVALLIIISLSPYIQQGQWPKNPFFFKNETPPVETGFTQQQMNEKVAAVTKSLETQIASLKGQLANAQKPQLQIGPQEAVIISRFFGNPNVIPKDTRWAIFFTYPPENQKFYNTLVALMTDQLKPWILNAPDNSTDLDAPKFPQPPTDPGITLHGDNALNTALLQILAQCFLVRHTDKEIDGLSEWFNKRLSAPERAENRKITWIEIGHGSPWLQGNRLSTNCLQ